MASIFIATKHHSESSCLSTDGVVLFIHFDSISCIGEEYRLNRLDDYIYTPTEQIADFLRSSGATQEQIDNSNPVIWFEAEHGLELTQKYAQIVRSYHTISETTKTNVLSDLGGFVKVFEVLVRSNRSGCSYATM